MRHTIEFNDTDGVYMCAVCGAWFTQDALIAEMDANGCDGPKADEGDFVLYTETPASNLTTGYYAWYRAHPDSPSGILADAEAKGRRLLKSAGYESDETGD